MEQEKEFQITLSEDQEQILNNGKGEFKEFHLYINSFFKDVNQILEDYKQEKNIMKNIILQIFLVKKIFL